MRIGFALSPILGNLVASAGLQLTVAALALVSGPMQARGLGSEGRGQLAVVLIIGQIASMVVDMGTGGYVIRQRANGKSRSELIGSVIPILVVSLGGSLLLSWPTALLFGGRNHVLKTMIMAQFMLLPAIVFVQTATSIALGEERIRVVIGMRLVAAVVPVIGLATLFMCGNLTLVNACLCYFIASLASMIPAVKIWTGAIPFKRDVNITKDAWKFGKASMMTMILSLGNVRADALIVAKDLSFHDAGLYVVASTLAGLPLMLANAAMQSLARRLSLDNLERTTAQASSLVSFGVLLTALLLAAVAPFIFPLLFGAAFAQSVSIAWLLLAGTVFGANANFLGIATTLAGKPNVAAVAQFAGIVTMIVAMLILSHYGGVLGAAAGSSLGYVVTLIVLLRHAQKSSNIKWYTYVFPSTEASYLLIRHTRNQ